MMRYIESPSQDPHFNLALEQYVFDHLPRCDSYFMLWQNENAIIIGKHQNALSEIDPVYVREHGIHVVRRLSGGGAVYHDLGNLNFTFIVDGQNGALFDFATFCRPVVKALDSLGVTASVNGRNDITIEGKKFSGNSQYIKGSRVMHHGTIMYDSNLEVVSKALRVSDDKLESKGLRSVRSRVTNVRPYVKNDASMVEFIRIFKRFMFEEYKLVPYSLGPEDFAAVEDLKRRVYDTWDWNYGSEPPYKLCKKRRLEGCGQIEVFMDVEKGILRHIRFFGDYFSTKDPDALEAMLAGCPVNEEALRKRMENVDLSSYFQNIQPKDLLGVLLY